MQIKITPGGLSRLSASQKTLEESVHEFQTGLGEDGRTGIGRKVEMIQVQYKCMECQLNLK